MNRSSAKRASGSGAEPSIDAINVKSVATFREDTALVLFFELRQANGALLQWRLMSLQVVNEDRNLLENRRVERGKGGGGDGGGGESSEVSTNTAANATVLTAE